MSDDPALWPAHRQAAAIRAKEISSRELFDHFVERIERLNPTINAVVTLDLERGKLGAAVADAAVVHGEKLGPLHGLPVTIKDALAVAGMRSTGGAVEFTDNIPSTDADVVAKVTAAGAFCFGKTNVPRWSGDYQTYNEIFGTTRNPWNPDLVPGGSSGGAAAAVATGLTSFEIGTDIGGSIRVPASYNGIAGHKPSYGLVPCGGYLDHVDGGLTEPDINVHGPLARSVDDLALLLDVIAGPRPDRAHAWRLDLPPARHDRVGDYRIALWLDDASCPVTNSTKSAVAAAARALETDGAHIDDAARPAIDANAAALIGLGLVGAAITPSLTEEEYGFYLAVEGDPNLSPIAAEAVNAFTRRHRSWLALDRERARIRSRWADFFRDVDVLLCPVIASPAFPHLQEGTYESRTLDFDGVTRPYADLGWWPMLIGMAYLPSTVVPVGRTAEGLPIGVQVVGPYLEDRTTLAIAKALTDRLGNPAPPPMAR